MTLYCITSAPTRDGGEARPEAKIGDLVEVPDGYTPDRDGDVWVEKHNGDEPDFRYLALSCLTPAAEVSYRVVGSPTYCGGRQPVPARDGIEVGDVLTLSVSEPDGDGDVEVATINGKPYRGSYAGETCFITRSALVLNVGEGAIEVPAAETEAASPVRVTPLALGAALELAKLHASAHEVATTAETLVADARTIQAALA